MWQPRKRLFNPAVSMLGRRTVMPWGRRQSTTATTTTTKDTTNVNFRVVYMRYKSSTSTSKSSGSASSDAVSASATFGVSAAGGGSPTAQTSRGLWQRYTDMLLRRPLLVKASTASLIFFVSDSATQYLTEPEDKPFHWGRAASGATFGVVATGWLHYWWGFLETAVAKRLPVTTHRLANTMTKVVIDQAIGAPIYIFTYYCITHFGKEYMSLVSSSSSSSSTTAVSSSSNQPSASESSSTSLSDAAYKLWIETVNRAVEMLPPTMMRHWSVWPLVHSINFYYFSLHHRVLVQNLVLVGWSGYLSHLNNGGLSTPHQPHGQLMTPEEEVESVAEEKTVLRLQRKATESESIQDQ